MWSRNQYLNEGRPVAEFVVYFAQILRGDESVGDFYPRYGDRFGVARPSEGWRLQDLRYEWNGANLAKCTWDLRPFRTALRKAGTKNGDPAKLIEAMKGIFDWGMDPRSAGRNHDWATERRDSIVDLYSTAMAALASDHPNYRVFASSQMNAGFTKVYAIPSLHTVIYDSRVAAGFCWLVRRFLLAHPHHLIGNRPPPGLRFGIPQGLGNPQRDPSCNLVRFPGLSTPRVWAKSNVHASWIITEAIQKAGSLRWCRGPFALRRVEAALFMLGYRIAPEDAGGPPKLPRPTPPSVSFDVAYEQLSRQPNATVELTTAAGTAFSATAGIGRNGLQKVYFPHSYSVDRDYWGTKRNHINQHVGQYTDALALWVSSNNN